MCMYTCIRSNKNTTKIVLKTKNATQRKKISSAKSETRTKQYTCTPINTQQHLQRTKDNCNQFTKDVIFECNADGSHSFRGHWLYNIAHHLILVMSREPVRLPITSKDPVAPE